MADTRPRAKEILWLAEKTLGWSLLPTTGGMWLATQTATARPILGFNPFNDLGDAMLCLYMFLDKCDDDSEWCMSHVKGKMYEFSLLYGVLDEHHSGDVTPQIAICNVLLSVTGWWDRQVKK